MTYAIDKILTKKKSFEFSLKEKRDPTDPPPQKKTLKEIIGGEKKYKLRATN